MSLENASDEEKLVDDNDTETVKDTSHEYVAKLRLPRRRLEDEDVTSKLSISLAESMLVSSTMVVLSDSLSLVVGALDIDVSDRLVLIETVSAVVGDELEAAWASAPWVPTTVAATASGQATAQWTEKPLAPVTAEGWAQLKGAVTVQQSAARWDRGMAPQRARKAAPMASRKAQSWEATSEAKLACSWAEATVRGSELGGRQCGQSRREGTHGRLDCDRGRRCGLPAGRKARQRARRNRRQMRRSEGWCKAGRTRWQQSRRV